MKTKYKIEFFAALLMSIGLHFSLSSFCQTQMTNSGTLYNSTGTLLFVTGDFTNNSGGVFASPGLLELDANFINNATFTHSNGEVQFSGSSQQAITGATSFYSIVLNNSSTGLLLNNNISIANQIGFTDGNINLNGKIITLSSTANLVNESNNNRIFGTSGTIETTRTFNAGSLTTGVNIGNMGIVLTTDSSLGTLTVIRGHAVQTNGESQSIARYFDFTSGSKASINATIKMYYFENELNGMLESDIYLWQTSDGTIWNFQDQTSIDTVNNFMQKSGVSSLVKSTLSNTNNALPITLLQFDALCTDGNINILWTTVSEVNCDHFELEKTFDLLNFEVLGKIKAAGNSNSTLEYSFYDQNFSGGKAFYRLVEVDFNGKKTFSKFISSNCFDNTQTQIIASPNPFKDVINLKFLSENQGDAQINIFASDGRLVYYNALEINKLNSNFMLNPNGIAPGFYTLQIVFGSEIKSFKMVKN